MEIPFLDLKRIDSALQHKLTLKFSEMLQKGIFSGGEEVTTFESYVSEFLQSSFAISCANGTDALELALRALQIGDGDEVIVPAMTWVSTAEAVKMVGAQPVFWDTDKDGSIDGDWEKAITSKTKAVIPVHLYGKMVEMDSLMEKARANNLYVIEDAAQAFGAFQRNKAAGTFSDIGCLSFYPTKNLGALGEAGMCLTKNQILVNQLRLLLNHGQPQRDRHELIGRNSRIDTIQAGFLNVITDEFDRFQDKRKSISRVYLESLKAIDQIILPYSILSADHSAHLFVIQTDRRDELQSFLMSERIGTAIHYPSILPDMKPFATEGIFVNSRKLSQRGLSIPLNPWLKEAEVLFIVQKIKEFFSNFPR